MEIARVKGESASIKAEQDQWVNLTQLESDDVNQNELRPIGIEQTGMGSMGIKMCQSGPIRSINQRQILQSLTFIIALIALV